MPQTAAPPRPRLVCKRSELSGGGTASMPVREKRRRSPSSLPARPFSRPPPSADRRQSAGLCAYGHQVPPLRQTACWREPDSNPRSPRQSGGPNSADSAATVFSPENAAIATRALNSALRCFRFMPTSHALSGPVSLGLPSCLKFRIRRAFPRCALATHEISPATQILEGTAFGSDGRLWAVSEAGSRHIYDPSLPRSFEPFFPLAFALDLSRLE